MSCPHHGMGPCPVTIGQQAAEQIMASKGREELREIVAEAMRQMQAWGPTVKAMPDAGVDTSDRAKNRAKGVAR